MQHAVRNYLIVTASYWGFTLVDGALRMLVLLHFFNLGYSPLTLSFLFLLYEFAGIVANIAGGWLATRFGVPRMLAVGQSLQVAGLLMLSALEATWTAAASVVWVVAAQGISGLAKNFTKRHPSPRSRRPPRRDPDNLSHGSLGSPDPRTP